MTSELRTGAGTLLAVPAVHFRVEFAQEVNAACGDPGRRPQAIAVELGALTAVAARAWLQELGIGPERRMPLPCMLGMVRRNRYLRASMRERVFELQRSTGIDLQRISPAILHEELHLASTEVFVLSPTDSIVEAIRCACELDVPLYGVDLEEMATPLYPPAILPESGRSTAVDSGNLRHFAAAAPADHEVDPRRELAMAARLKGLLDRHGRVLFTCGMAHWERIARRLADPELRPSLKGLDATATDVGERLRRVVVDPALAVAHMDAFPAVATAHERRRRHPLLDPPGPVRPIPRGAILRSLLRKTYRRHFVAGTAASVGAHAAWRDWPGRLALERLLRGRMLLEMRTQPSLHLLEACARATVSRELRDLLRRTCSEFRWVEPAAAGDCGMLRPALAGEGKTGLVIVADGRGGKGAAEVPNLFPGGLVGKEAFPLPEEWREPVALRLRSSGYRFTWRPWEDLIDGLCAQAIGRSLPRRRAPHAEPYAGQLLEGIDVKTTLRAQSRGEERFWVRDTRRMRGAAVPEIHEGFPVVWIFDDGTADRPAPSWSTYFEPVDWLANFSGDPGGFRRLLPGRGDGLIDLIVYGRPVPAASEDLAAANIGVELLSGLIVYAPIFRTYRQTVSWYLVTRAARNPLTVCWGGGTRNSLVKQLAERTHTAGDALSWQQLMLAAALPFAGESLTVVAPPGFAVTPAIARAAERCGKKLSLVPSSTFPQDLLGRVVRYHALPGRLDEAGATVYAAEAERLIGEPLERYSHLVPESWRTFGLGR